MSPVLGRRQPTLDLGPRLAALTEAVAAGRGRLPDSVIDPATAVVMRAGERVALSGEHTVVALAGSTGSGKSSLFNAITGLDLARVGVRRPTTAQALACVWNPEGTAPLLDWLGIPRRHQIARESELDDGPVSDLGGLILLDLPDHDSTEVSHRVQVDRLVQRVDLMVWVVDPQKYADAVLHEHYLQRLTRHRDVLVVAINQVDRLAPAERDRCVADLRRLLAADGLDGITVLALSAKTGEGVEDLMGLLQETAAKRRAADDRLLADVAAVATDLLGACGEGETHGRGDRELSALVRALEQAAGVDTVVTAVRTSTLRRARAATGWPITRWLGRFRRDPLRRLGLRPTEAPQLLRSSLPPPTAVTRARSDAALRSYADAAAAGAPANWVLAARSKALGASDGLDDALDQAVIGTRLDAERQPHWWRAVGLLQWLLLGCMVVGLAWLGLLAALDYLRLPEPSTPTWREIPVPTALAVGGFLSGVLLAVLARLLAALGARRRAGRARRRLRESIAAVAEERVVEPVAAELDALQACRSAALVASGAAAGRSRRR